MRLLVLLAVLLAFPAETPALSQTRSATVLANDSGVGAVPWNIPGLPTSGDADAILESFEITNFLKSTGYGFSLPEPSTIDGIEVSLRKRAPVFGNITDGAFRIVKAGVIGTDDRADSEEWPGGLEAFVYGSPGDLWGESWSAADINSSDFGAAIAAHAGPGSTAIPSVQDLEITVHFFTCALAPDCAALNRAPCGSGSSNTCGLCNEGTYGQPLGQVGNTQCSELSEFPVQVPATSPLAAASMGLLFLVGGMRALRRHRAHTR